MNRARVVLYHNVMAPYRHALFRALAAKVDLEVWFSVRTTRDRDWGRDDPEGYAYRVLNGRTWYAFNRPLILVPGLIRDIKRSRPDAIVTVLTRSNALDVLRIAAAGQRLRIPVVLWIGNVEYPPCFDDGLPSLLNRAFETYYRFVIQQASGFIFYSSLSEKWALARGASGPRAIGTQVLEAASANPRIDVAAVAGTPLKILFAGKLEERKGFDLLVKSVAAVESDFLNGLEVWVAGAGSSQGVQGPSNTTASIRYLGYVTRSELWDLYRRCDLLVLPSRHDPWGFVVNEAMSMGTPVLASSACGAAELASKAGWLFDPCKPSDLSVQLRMALPACRNPHLRAQSVAAERLYRPEACADRIAGLIGRVARRA